MLVVDVHSTVAAGGDQSLTQLLRSAVNTGTAPLTLPGPGSTSNLDYACWRFLKRLQTNPTPTLDHGVLLRQVVRWAGGQFFVGGWHAAIAAVAQRCDVTLSAVGDLTAEPFRPDWLEEAWPVGLGLDELPVSALPDEKLPAEPWLWSLAHGTRQTWHSPAQKEACWQALTAPRGSTTLLGLPTGAGKSLCFQLAARFSTGTTIVVVPTTALAIDQYLAAEELLADFAHLGPRYYSSNDAKSDPASVRAALRDGSCRLLFTSPEACVSGSLRVIIDELAEAGRLDTLVVDEAHIIDSWGGHFRVEFQLLALRRAQWFEASGGNLRTLLLSATFTPQCLTLLKELFGQPSWRQFASQRLRPEIAYYRAPFVNADQRHAALIEALHHLPRPLILYVTKVEDAETFAATLAAEGFEATRCFHGETAGNDRRRLLEAWRANEIDIMVATSAFGMGVDKGDVRAVIHACYPENVHRYYQEVGRGGRDGARSVALWLPLLPQDRNVAKSLLPTMLGERKIDLRWQTMVDAAREDEDGVLDIPTNAKHDELMGGRSYGENIRWNKRLLLMMARANLLGFDNLSIEDDETEFEGRVERVRVITNFSRLTSSVAPLLMEQRQRELDAAASGIDALAKYLDGTAKICRLLRREYGDETIIACGGCFACRDHGFDVGVVPFLEFDPSRPTKPEIDIVATDLTTDGKKAMSLLAELVGDLVDQQGVSQFLCDPSLRAPLIAALSNSYGPRGLYRIDTSDTINRLIIDAASQVVAIHGDQVDRALLRARAGRRISHLFMRNAPITDPNGRILLHHEGAQFFPAIKDWRATI